MSKRNLEINMPMTKAEREQMLKECEKAQVNSRINRGGPITLDDRKSYRDGFEDGWNTVFRLLAEQEDGEQ